MAATIVFTVASPPDTSRSHSALPHSGGLIDTVKFSGQRHKVQGGGGGGDSDGLVFHPREAAKFLVTAHFQNNFLSAKNLSFLESLNCFIFFQVYCEYRALLAEDATSSRQKNVRHFALYELCCS